MIPAHGHGNVPARGACHRLVRALVLDPLQCDWDGTADRVAHRRVSLREGQELIELLVRAVGLDVHLDADLLVPDRHGIVESEQPLHVDLAFQRCRQLLNVNPTRGRMQDGVVVTHPASA